MSNLKRLKLTCRGMTLPEASVVILVLSIAIIGVLDYISAFNRTVFPILTSQEWRGRLIVHYSDAALWSSRPPRWEDGSPCTAPPYYIGFFPYYCVALNPSAKEFCPILYGETCASLFWGNERLFSYPCNWSGTEIVKSRWGGPHQFKVQTTRYGEIVQITVRYEGPWVFRESVFFVPPQ